MENCSVLLIKFLRFSSKMSYLMVSLMSSLSITTDYKDWETIDSPSLVCESSSDSVDLTSKTSCLLNIVILQYNLLIYGKFNKEDSVAVSK